MHTRHKGFTLIELLVVIAIIAILAAMLFPVFARARESARKIQCLSNVKNIAMAFQMYLTDYDGFPPFLSGSAYNNVYELLLAANADRGRMCQYRAFQSNPYLRWQVVLDEYVKNREVWNCPSARWMEGFDVVFDPGGADGWAHWFADHPFSGWSGQYLYHPCMGYFPTGWGGTVTDSVTQFSEVSYLGVGYDSVEGQFGGSIGVEEGNDVGVKTSQINNPANFVVCGDSASMQMWTARLDVWQVCQVQGGCADWVNCSWTQQCGIDEAHFKQFWSDPSYRTKYTRHLGGSNIGFADGHAAWWNAEAYIAAVPHRVCPNCDTIVPGATLEGTCTNIVDCPDW